MSSVENSHNCVFCNESFTDKETLQVHFRKHGDPQFMKESPAKSKTPEHDNVQGPEAVTEKKVELVSCDVCTEVFSTISKAITHKHKMHPDHDAKYFCCWCGKLFTLKHLYNKHLISHNTESRGSGNVYHCDSCNVNFNVPSAMTYHNKIFHHQDTNLSTIGHSTKQKLIDQELCQLYYCAFCGEEYINKVNLHKHMTDDHSDEIQSPNEVLRCPLCQAIFYHLDAYEIHLTFHSAEDVYHDNEASKCELTEFSLDSVPPVPEKVEEYESGPEAKSPDDGINLDQLLQLASGETKKKHKKHKKHKKSKKSAITLDEFLNMNTDVFGEGLNFQGAEEVPTQVVSKRLKVKASPRTTPGATVKKELDKLKQQGIVIKKKSNKVPVFPGVKVQLGMQNKVQRPLKIAPCALKPPSNVTNSETQLKKVLPKTNEEVLSKLLNQSQSQIQIIKKPLGKTTEESVLCSLSDTPEKIEVECDLLLRSSEPSSELDPEDNVELNKSDDIANVSALPGPTNASIKESDITEKQLTERNEECDNSSKTNESLDQEASEHNNDSMDSNINDGKKNFDSLKALKNIQHLTIKQLKPPENHPVQEPCVSNVGTEGKSEEDFTDSDFEDAIPATKIIQTTQNTGEKTRKTPVNNSTQKPVITSVHPPMMHAKQDKNEDEKAKKTIPNIVTVKPNTTEEKQDVHAKSGKNTADFLKNISQQISIKPVCTNKVKPSGLQEIHGPTTNALKNLSRHITVKPVTQPAKTAINDEVDKKFAAENVTTGSKKITPMPQGNIKHFPQITVTSLSKKVSDDCKHSDSEDFDEFDSDVDDDINPKNSEAVTNIEDIKNRNQQQMQHSQQQSITKTHKISHSILNNKQISIKSSNHTFTSTSSNVKESYDEGEADERDFSDKEDDADRVPKQENIPLQSHKQILQEKLLNKNVIIKSAKNNSPANSRENTIQSPCHSPNSKKVVPASDQKPPKDEASNRIGLLQKFNQGITIKTVPQKEKVVTEDPEIFNIDDSDSDDSKLPVVPVSSQTPIPSNRSNLGPNKNESLTSLHNIKQREQLQPKNQQNQPQTISSRVQPKWQLVKHTAQPIIKSDDDMQNDYFSTDEDQLKQHSDSDDSPDICPNISKLLSNKNISLKNMQGSVTQALKQSMHSSPQFLGNVVKKSQNGQSKSDLLKDFHFNESSEEDNEASLPLNHNSMKTTGKELAIRRSDDVMSDNDDDNFDDINESEGGPFKNHSKDVINKLKSLNANLSFKSNNPIGQQMLNKISQNLSESVAMKSSSNQSKKTVTYTQSRAMKRDASDSLSRNTYIKKDLPVNPCKQIKLADEEPQSDDALNSTANQSKMLSQLSDRNAVNQEVTTSVKTIQTKTLVQEITTTVTRTIKTVNQEVAVMSTQIAGNASLTNIPRTPKFIQGMPRAPTQVRTLSNAGTPFRLRSPANTANIRPLNPARPSVNTAIRSPNNTPRMRPPGMQQVRPGTNRMPMMKKVPTVQGNQPQNRPAGKPIKIAPNVLKQQQQRPQHSMKRVSEPGPFSCFKKPNESLFPSGLPSDTAAVASTSQISHSNFSSSTKTFNSDSFVTATKTKSEVHSSHQEISKLSNLSGIKVVRSSQSSQAIKEVQKIEVSDPKRQSTLEAIQRLQKQGLLLKKPRLEEPDDCEQSNSSGEDNDNPNLAIEDGG